jgi:hypothetical protein
MVGSVLTALVFWPSELKPPNPLARPPVAEVSAAPARIEVSTTQSYAANTVPQPKPPEEPKNDPPVALQPSPRVAQNILNRINTFDDLKRETNAYLNNRDGDVAIALYQPEKGFRLAIDADQPYPLASLSKVHIMLTYLDRIRQANRQPTSEERALLHSMIIESDNAAADSLWNTMGGARTLKSYMDSLGLQAIVTSGAWGANQDTAREVAALLARLGTGDILDAPGRQIASELLFRTSPAQRWGVSSGLPQNRLLLKDGWFPGEEGWRVNSAGIVAGPDGRMAYILVVLTDSQPSMQYGVDTIEAVSQMANSLMAKNPR